MADVRIVCVRDDVVRADALAQDLEAQGLNVTDDPNCEASVSVLMWSDASAASPAFLKKACDAVLADTALIASLTPPVAPRLGRALVFDLRAWSAGEAGALAPLIEAISDRLPAQPLTLPDFPILPPPAETRYYADEGEVELARETPPEVQDFQVRTMRWRRLCAERARLRRFAAAAAAAMALVMVVGLQAHTAQSGAALTATPAAVTQTATAVSALYDPVEIAELEALPLVPEAVEPPAPARYGIEPASAPRGRTPAPYRSWERQAEARPAAAFVMPAPIPLELIEAPASQAAVAHVAEAAPSLWQTAAYKPS
jgi:hypothetical protein